MSEAEAHVRFDAMIERCAELPFAKQPIVERSSDAVVGYTGVDWIDVDGGRWLEWGGYRLAPEARGKGYATEASTALLAAAAQAHSGEVLGIVHPDNDPSHRVIESSASSTGSGLGARRSSRPLPPAPVGIGRRCAGARWLPLPSNLASTAAHIPAQRTKKGGGVGSGG